MTRAGLPIFTLEGDLKRFMLFIRQLGIGAIAITGVESLGFIRCLQSAFILSAYRGGRNESTAPNTYTGAKMNPNKIYKEFIEAGTDWADKHGAAELLEAGLKPLKAQLTLEAKNLENCSMAEATDIALSASTYRDALVAAVHARTEANRAKVRYEATKALFEAQRTAEASERSAMRAAV